MNQTYPANHGGGGPPSTFDLSIELQAGVSPDAATERVSHRADVIYSRRGKRHRVIQNR